MKAIGHMDEARGHVLRRFDDMQEQLRDHGRVWEQIQNQMPRAQPYTG